jgi:regulator of sigma E protease
MLSFFVFLFILGLLIIVHEFGHFITAKKMGVRVEKFSVGFGPQLFKRTKDDTEYSISAIPLGGYVKLAGDSLEEFKGNNFEYMAKKPGERFRILLFGSLLNYILGFLCFWLIFFIGYPTFTTKVGGLLDGYGAKDAGIEVGDKIIAIDGVKVYLWEDIQKTVRLKKANEWVRVNILRDNQGYTKDVLLKTKELDDPLGKKQNVGVLGVKPQDEIIKVKYGFIKSFFLSVDKTWELTSMTYSAIWRLISGKLSIRESVAGPLGIFQITTEAVQHGVVAVLHLIAVLSVGLSIFNLLPLPALDGGHILLLGIEKIRGKTLNIKTERIITQFGFTLIITLAIYITYNDLMRMFGDKVTKIFK